MINVAHFTARLKEFDALRDSDTLNTGTVGRVKPRYADAWPTQLSQPIRDVLSNIGISRPYLHQAEAINKSLGGADVVLESPTASGKTLAFTLPLLHSLKQDKDSHALMVYPMKALAFDQREQIREICQPLSVESWPYDGDTPEDIRKVLRENPPDILLTNPEYLNMSFLAWKETWERFLRNLRYVVIDEMHEYRGFFGSNMALLLRRFFRHLEQIGATPQVFLSTATCANPTEHARALTGRDVEEVSARQVLRPQRHFFFVDPDIPDYQYRDILRLRVEQAAISVLAEDMQALIFCPTKRFLEEAFRHCQRKAEKLGLDPNRISAYHADLKSEDRQMIQQRIKSEDIGVVFTTNALELGLDIGALDGIIMAGFPPSIMSAWQQIGRAGRGWNKEAFVLFFSMNDPIDRFFVGNLNAFLHKPFDELVVDPTNEELIKNHLPSLLQESGGMVEPSEKPILGNAFYDAAKKSRGRAVVGYSPQRNLNLRGGFGASYELKRGDEELGQISAIRRFREAYIGAIFPFFGRKYQVHSHEERAVILVDVDQNLKTEPGFFTIPPNITNVFDGYSYGDIEVFYGSLNIGMNFTGYRLVDERSGEIKDSGGSNEAHYENNLHSFWIQVPQSKVAAAGIGALEHMIRVGAMFVIPVDRFDTSTYSKIGDPSTAFCYENYSGGIGVARKLFQVWQIALEKGIDIASNCDCASGCPNCIEPAKSWNISNEAIDKKLGITLASMLLELAHEGPDHKFKDGIMLPV